MTERLSPTSKEAVNLLKQAETTLTHTRRNTGWPTVTAQMSMGAATSVYLLVSHDTQFGAVPFIDIMVQMLAPLVLVVMFAKVAKNGFGTRWDVYMAVWVLCWSISIFFSTVVVRVPLMAVIAVVSFVGALVGVHR